MAAKGQDQYANFAIISVTESAANTLTFTKLETGVGLFERVGWLISRVDWYDRGSINQLNSNSDQIDGAIVQSNAVSGISASSTQVLVHKVWYRQDFGTAATAFINMDPKTDDYSTLPGGGILVLPNPLYLAVKATGAAAACSLTARIWYKSVSLTDADYFDLMQSRQVLSA